MEAPNWVRFVSPLCMHEIVPVYFQIAPKEPCADALTKMSSCPACQGIPEILPCPDYCVNVMKGCLAYHAELGHSWDKFVGEYVSCKRNACGQGFSGKSCKTQGLRNRPQ